MIDRPSPGLPTPDGASSNWVGVNFWSRAGGPRMWSAAFDEDVVRHELQILAERDSTYFLPYTAPVHNPHDGSFHTKVVHRSDVERRELEFVTHFATGC